MLLLCDNDADVCHLVLTGRVPNAKGRVLRSGQGTEGTAIENGLYVVGWLKRGPSGIIGTNLVDAEETVCVKSLCHQLCCSPQIVPFWHNLTIGFCNVCDFVYEHVTRFLSVTWSTYLPPNVIPLRFGVSAICPVDFTCIVLNGIIISKFLKSLKRPKYICRKVLSLYCWPCLPCRSVCCVSLPEAFLHKCILSIW
jgi:hypothetical protein